MLRGVGLILSEMQRIAFSPIAFVGVCPYMCVCVCVCSSVECLVVGLHENSLREKSAIVSLSCRPLTSIQ